MIILVGPSASGKSVVVNKMKEKYDFLKVVTYTTRPMRNGEINHIDYHFISKEEFLQKKKENWFIETACYNDNYYGTAYEDISENKVLIVEPSGANVYYEKLKNQVMIIYLDVSEEIRQNRMLERGDSLDSINKRMASDKEYFSFEKINHIDMIVKTDKKTIEEVTDIIVNEYKLRFKK